MKDFYELVRPLQPDALRHWEGSWHQDQCREGSSKSPVVKGGRFAGGSYSGGGLMTQSNTNDTQTFTRIRGELFDYRSA